MDPLLRTTVGKRYVVQRGPLGETGEADAGGWSDVYLAVDRRMHDRRVVLKFPKRALLEGPEGKRFRARFAREIQTLIASGEDCPGVVPILDAGEHGGRPYCVLTYVAGGSLEGRLSRREQTADGRVRRYVVLQTPAEVAAWLPAVATAIDTVHLRGIVHRDVKPANILFSGNGTPYLSDFGIARIVEATGATPGLTETAMRNALYTAGYESPEFIAGLRADFAYDRYALGVVAFRALTGRLPHWPTDRDVVDPRKAMAMRRATEPAEDVRSLQPQISAAVAAVVAKALARRVGDRYGTCLAFADALRAALGDAAGTLPSPNLAVTEPPPQDPRDEGDDASGAVGAATPVGPARPAGRRASTWIAALATLVVGVAAAWIAGLLPGNGRPSGGASRQTGEVPAARAPAPPAVAPEAPPAMAPDASPAMDGPPAMEATPPPAPPDTTPPVLVVLPTGADVEAPTGDVTFTGTATDDRGPVAVFVDGDEVAGVAAGRFTHTVTGLAAGAQRVVAFWAEDGAHNRSAVARRTVTRPAPDPAWKAPLAAAKAAGQASPPEWDAAAAHLSKALANDVPSAQVPKWLEDGVALWTQAPKISKPQPDSGRVLAAVVPVTVEIATPRPADTVWIAGVQVQEGAGQAHRDVDVPLGDSTILIEVRDERGRVRASSEIRISRRALPPKPSWARTSPEQDAYAERVGLPVWHETDLGGGPPLRFVLVPPGSFLMSDSGEVSTKEAVEVLAKRNSRRRVTLTRPFYLSIYELTFGQYERIVGTSNLPRWASTERITNEYADEEVPFDDVSSLTERLRAREGGHYRLPTEAEWEYACRAGTTTLYSVGDTLTSADAHVAGQGTSPFPGPVGRYRPNGFGLYDMHGNAIEWTADFYAPLENAPQVDPRGPAEGSDRVQRGGCACAYVSWARSGARALANPCKVPPPADGGRHVQDSAGVRLVREAR